MATGDAVHQSTKFQEGEVGEFYLPTFCAVRFGWTPEQTYEQNWDYLWGILAVLPEIEGQEGNKRESEEQKRDRKAQEYLARSECRGTRTRR